MDAKIVGRDCIEIELNPSDFYMNEKKIREVIHFLERKLFELHKIQDDSVVADKQGCFKFSSG